MEPLIKASVAVFGLLGLAAMLRKDETESGNLLHAGMAPETMTDPEPEQEMVYITPQDGDRWLDDDGVELRATKVGGRPKTVSEG